MGTTLDETRLELEAQRARVRGTAERLESTARKSLDVRAIIGRHPARVVEFVPYDAPRPRSDKTLSEPAFIATKAHCLKLFQREVRRG